MLKLMVDNSYDDFDGFRMRIVRSIKDMGEYIKICLAPKMYCFEN